MYLHTMSNSHSIYVSMSAYFVPCSQMMVTQRPRVAVLSTGNEVVDPGERLGAGQIYDSNRTSLMAAVREQGLAAVDLGVARDE